MARIICDYCGTEYDDIQQRCPLCGSVNLNEATPEETGPETTERVRKPRGGRYSAPKSSRAAKPNKRPKEDSGSDEDRIPKWLIIMICIVLGLAVVIGALYAMYAVGVFSPKKQLSEDAKLPEQQITEEVDTNKPENDQEEATVPEEQEKPEETEPTEILCTGITLSQSTVSLESAGLATTVNAAVVPADCTEDILWSSSDTTVCTVDDLGVITAVDGGKAVVTATCGAFSAQVEVVCDFSNSKENNAYLSLTDFTLFATGDKATIQVLDAPEGANITWSSSNTGVCTVSGGTVTAVKAGTATVTAQVNDKKLTCIVRCNIEGSVVANDSNAESTGSSSSETSSSGGTYQLDHTDVTLAVGHTFELSVVGGVSGGWNVTDSSVITIDGNGNVTALASGTAKVYTTVGGQRLECIVRVP